MCPDWELNPQPWHMGIQLQPMEPPIQAHVKIIFVVTPFRQNQHSRLSEAPCVLFQEEGLMQGELTAVMRWQWSLFAT